MECGWCLCSFGGKEVVVEWSGRVGFWIGVLVIEVLLVRWYWLGGCWVDGVGFGLMRSFFGLIVLGGGLSLISIFGVDRCGGCFFCILF